MSDALDSVVAAQRAWARAVAPRLSDREAAVLFLTTNSYIGRLNFAIPFSAYTYKVYPSAYQVDVAEAIKTGKIEIKRTKLDDDHARFDGKGLIEILPAFDFSNEVDQATFVHECTHAHLVIQAFGYHSRWEDETVAWLAEAVFLEAASFHVPRNPVENLSHEIARDILTRGTYWVSEGNARALAQTILCGYNDACYPFGYLGHPGDPYNPGLVSGGLSR
jgi:hypothetical protein